MLQLNEKILEMLEEDYLQMTKHCDLNILDPRLGITVSEAIRIMDHGLFNSKENPFSICNLMKMEIQTLEICSYENEFWTMENPDFKFSPRNYETLFKNYEKHHGPDDFGMRWPGMVHEMTSPENRKYAIYQFNNKFPGPLELFFIYRKKGMNYDYCKRHNNEEFTFPEFWGKLPDISETKIISLLWMYKE